MTDSLRWMCEVCTAFVSDEQGVPYGIRWSIGTDGDTIRNVCRDCRANFKLMVERFIDAKGEVR